MTACLWALLAGTIGSLCATRVVLSWLLRRQILDLPNDRSSHSRPTPRGGGLAVTPVLLVVWAGLALTGYAPPGLAPAMIGAAGLLALSWQDDKRGLSAGLRLALHVLAAAVGLLMVPADHLVFQGLLPWGLDRLLALCLWVWFINLYNFMDGIDGITGVETAVLGGGLAVVLLVGGAGPPAPLAAAAAGVGIGFLAWNWHPAKIFLGDSGSIPLGYLLGWLLLEAAGSGHWAAALILPLYYLADATLTLIRRALRGERIMQAHRQHFYQQALRAGVTHAGVVRQILVADLLLVLLALLAEHHPWIALAAAAVVVALLLKRLVHLGGGGRP